MSIVKRLPREKIAEAKMLLMSVNLEDKLEEVLSIIEKAYGEKPWLLSGRTAAGLLSGLIYLIARQNGARLTQREIAQALITTELTVRNSCRIWKKFGIVEERS
jgi:transcription initiation factor TFIIIB Brf1 subunit/transcription initiation factor TFIIB